MRRALFSPPASSAVRRSSTSLPKKQTVGIAWWEIFQVTKSRLGPAAAPGGIDCSGCVEGGLWARQAGIRYAGLRRQPPRFRRGGAARWPRHLAGPEYAVIPRRSTRRRCADATDKFVVIEGRVRRVGFGRSHIYLDLVPYDRSDDCHRTQAGEGIRGGGSSGRPLAGRIIRARGVLDNRFGPRVEVDEPAMIEILRRFDARGAGKPRP